MTCHLVLGLTAIDRLLMKINHLPDPECSVCDLEGETKLRRSVDAVFYLFCHTDVSY